MTRAHQYTKEYLIFKADLGFGIPWATLTKGCQDEAEDVAASYPSLLAVTARHGLINPMDRLIFNEAFTSSNSLSKVYQPMDKDLACDIHVVNLR